MKRLLYITITFVFVSVIVLFLLLSVDAHSGKTDFNGGHYDTSTGIYHYHHGYPAHIHYDIDGDGKNDCRYNFDVKTNANSGANTKNNYSNNVNYNSKGSDPSSLDEIIGIAVFTLILSIISLLIWLLFLIHNYSKFSSSVIVSSFCKECADITRTSLKSDLNTIEDNYLHIDSALQQKERLWALVSDTESTYREKTFVIIRRINISIWTSAILSFALLLIGIFAFYSNDAAALMCVAAIFTLVVFSFIYYKVTHRLNNIDQVFFNTIKKQENYHLKNVFGELTKKINDIYSFLGIPTDVKLTEHLPEEQKTRDYGSLTRYVSPYGKCYHQKRGCSSSFIPVNIYKLIYNRSHLSPCQKCNWQEKDVVLPSWYLYYIKVVNLYKEQQKIDQEEGGLS